MKLLAVLGMWSVGLDCLERASGIQPQHIFSTEALWVWYLIAGVWFISGIASIWLLEDKTKVKKG